MNDERLRESHAIETYKSLIQYGQLAIRFILLSNGGALVSLLAYLSNVSSSNLLIPDLKCPMLLFIAGLTSGGLMIFSSYKTQLSLFNESRTREKMGNHVSWQTISIILGILGIVCFSLGSVWTANIFFNFG